VGRGKTVAGGCHGTTAEGEGDRAGEPPHGTASADKASRTVPRPHAIDTEWGGQGQVPIRTEWGQ